MIRRYAAAVVAVVLALTTLGVRAQAPPPGPAVSGPPAPPAPVRMDIPAIGVHTRLVRLGLRPDGRPEVPLGGRDAPAGWYEQSPIPGDPGAAVLAGHVDPARDGPAVFHRLGELRRGDTITIRRTDGSRFTFEVTGVQLHATSAVPSGVARGPTPEPELHLVTYGGDFNPKRRKYRSNLLVSARIIQPGRAASGPAPARTSTDDVGAPAIPPRPAHEPMAKVNGDAHP